jgi:hypothetical protein
LLRGTWLAPRQIDPGTEAIIGKDRIQLNIDEDFATLIAAIASRPWRFARWLLSKHEIATVRRFLGHLVLGGSKPIDFLNGP